VYAQRLAEAHATIERDPWMALPRPRDIRFDASDFRKLRQRQEALKAQAKAHQDEVQRRRRVRQEPARDANFRDLLARIQSNPKLPLPPPARFSPAQLAELQRAKEYPTTGSECTGDHAPSIRHGPSMTSGTWQLFHLNPKAS
jgi:hypothetical protein